MYGETSSGKIDPSGGKRCKREGTACFWEALAWEVGQTTGREVSSQKLDQPIENRAQRATRNAAVEDRGRGRELRWRRSQQSRLSEQAGGYIQGGREGRRGGCQCVVVRLLVVCGAKPDSRCCLSARNRTLQLVMLAPDPMLAPVRAALPLLLSPCTQAYQCSRRRYPSFSVSLAGCFGSFPALVPVVRDILPRQIVLQRRRLVWY